MSISKSSSTFHYQPARFYFCIFALVWITLLLFAGGFTTSIKAGMAFLDWPLSNGSLNPEGWMQDSHMAAEHSHRLLGMIIGILSIILLIWTWLKESRKWIRILSLSLLVLVVLQGLLGGARVVFDRLNTQTDHNFVAQSFAVAHACGAMIVLCILVSITLASSRHWIERNSGFTQSVPKSIHNWGLVACGTIFLQILIGAIMRHADAGLAIARFPKATANSYLPEYWNFAVSINFAHRIGAIIVCAVLLYYCVTLLRSGATRRAVGYGAIGIFCILNVQILLGALTIWSAKNQYAATMHHLIGAFLLASTWGVTFLTFSSKHRPESTI